MELYQLAVEQFTTADHYAIIATFVIVVIMLLFAGYSRWGGPRG